MGILKHLLFWPVTGPSFLARYSMEKVLDTAKHELTDDAPIKEELLTLQMRLELGEIEEHDYLAREAELMDRLRDVRAWREEFGMSAGGGPVRVASDEPVAQSPDEGASGDAGDPTPGEESPGETSR